jgi:hypothetical protein
MALLVLPVFVVIVNYIFFSVVYDNINLKRGVTFCIFVYLWVVRVFGFILDGKN